MLEHPIFLIGAARSGTSITADLLALHPAVAYWCEPRYVWRRGAASSLHDRRRPEDATPTVRRHIRREFARFTERQNKTRFLEKTPSNCFRVAFMAEVFPDGRFIHLLRDGRDTSASAFQRWCSPPDDGALLRRLRNFEIPLRDLLAYAPDAMREIVLRRLQPGRGHIWGPRYPGLQEERLTQNTATLCARQWVESVRTASRELANLPADQVLTLQYEDLVADPWGKMNSVLEFAGLPADEELLKTAVETLQPGGAQAWDKLSERDRETMQDIIRPVMTELGIRAAPLRGAI